MHELFINSPPAVDWDDLRVVLDEAMDELSDADRTAVLLRFFQQRPFAEVGAALQLSEDAARMRVERALDKLHLLLTRRGITSTTAALTTALASDALGAAPAGMVASVAHSARIAAAAATSPVANLTAMLRALTASKTTGALGIAAAFAITAAVFLLNSDQAVIASSAAARRDNDALARRLGDLEMRARTAEHERQALEKTAMGWRTVMAPVNAVRAKAIIDANQLKVIDSALSADPRLQQLLLSRSRLNIRVNYVSWFRRLGWTPAQIDAFADFVFDYASRLPSQPNYQPEPDMASDPNFAAAVRIRFGEAVAESYAKCQNTIIERRNVEQVFGCLGTAGQPLTPEQADRLTEIFATAHPPMHKLVPQVYAEEWTPPGYSKPLTGISFLGNYLEVMDWDQVLARAETVLAPAQLTVVRAVAAKVRAAVQLRIAATQNGGEAEP